MILAFHVPPLEGRGYVISFIAQKNSEKYKKWEVTAKLDR